jgi:MFS family permease
MSVSFFAIAASSPFLMKDLLNRTAAEYGLYFMCFPLGYCAGNLISSRLSGRVGIEKMVLTGSLLCFAIAVAQTAIIADGYLSPAIIFVPGGLMSFAQGLSLPNAQAGAIRVKPALAGTAAGLGARPRPKSMALWRMGRPDDHYFHGWSGDGGCRRRSAILATFKVGTLNSTTRQKFVP